ncbi:MAG: LacI family DNA-binding transcriptional regulator [Armatimonadota bacterium]
MTESNDDLAVKQKRTENPRRATLSDVAREAGVSAVAVSVVLNGTKTGTRVSEASRQRITAAAQRLRYTPNQAARSLARGQSKVVGIVLGHLRPLSAGTHDLGNEYTLFVIEGITAACGERGYHLFVFTNPWRETPEALEILRDRRTDGLILLAPPADTRILSDLCAVNVPFVCVGNPAEGLGVSTVDIDDVRGTRLALEHLYALGHRRIAHILGPPTASSPRRRLASYREWLAEAAIPNRPEYEVEGYPVGIYGEEGVAVMRENVRKLLALPEPPTAIFACDDSLAVKVIDEATKAGFAVPERLSVVGFDDRPMASIITPPLTTIRQPMVQIGYIAANTLIDQLEAEHSGTEAPAPRAVHMTPELMVRQSTAPPRY